VLRRTLFASRRSAYRAVLKPNASEQLSGEAMAAMARLVLADLAKVCRAKLPTHYRGDPNETAYREGKRAVWLHINSYLRMTDDQIAEITEENAA